MSKKLTAVFAPLAVAALLIPVAAGAHSKPTLRTVKDHVRASQIELGQAQGAIARGRHAAGQGTFAASRRQLRLAKRDAMALTGSADTASERTAAALALRALAAAQSGNVDELLALVEEVRRSFEDNVVLAALSDARGREEVLALLGEVVETRLPADVRERIARAIAALSSGHDEEVAAIAGLLSDGTLSPEAEAALGDIVDVLVAAQQEAIDRLEELLASGKLSPEAAQFVQGVIDVLQSDFDDIVAVLQGVLAQLPDSVQPAFQHFLEQIDPAELQHLIDHTNDVLGPLTGKWLGA